MTTTYIHTCDRCNKQVPTPFKLYLVTVVTRMKRHNGYSTDEVEHGQDDWCEDCLRELGLLPPKEPEHSDDPVPVKPERSIEDLVREIVRDELAQAEREG